MIARSTGCMSGLETALGWPDAQRAANVDHGVEGATTALARLTRGARSRRSLRTVGDASGRNRPGSGGALGAAGGPLLNENLNPSLEITKKSGISMPLARSTRFRRHLRLSAKPGADKQAFHGRGRRHARERVRRAPISLRDAHEPPPHPCPRAAVRLTRSDGERLDPKSRTSRVGGKRSRTKRASVTFPWRLSASTRRTPPPPGSTSSEW